MAIGDIYLVRFVTFRTDQLGVNVRHYQIVGETGLGVSSTEAAVVMDGNFAAEYKALLSSSATYRGVGVQKIRPLPPTAEGVSVANSGAGSVTGDPLPKQVAGLIALRTTFAGRKFRGRLFFPFASEDDNDLNSFPRATYQTRLNALAVELLLPVTVVGAVGTATFRPGLFHRLTGTIDPLSSFVVRGVWANQRRRGDTGRVNTLPF